MKRTRDRNPPQASARFRIRLLVTGTHHDGKLLDPGARRFLEDDLQGGLRFAGRVDQRLQRQRALTGIGGSDEDFSNSHERGDANAEPEYASGRRRTRKRPLPIVPGHNRPWGLTGT